MDFLVKHFGMAVLYAACAVVVLALVFLPGQSGLLNRVGSTMSGWRATDTSGYVAYASESQQGHPVVEYSRADALAPGTYSISDLITAKDHNGNDARLAVLQMTLPVGSEVAVDRSATEITFPVRGVYTLQVEARDSSQRIVIKDIVIPVN